RAQVARTIDVLDTWDVPADWQQPRPALVVHDGTGYVTDPARQRVLAVDLDSGEIWNEASLSVTPNEIVLTSGDVASSDGGTHDAHDHDHRSEEHTSELQSRENLVCRLLLEKKNKYASNED